MAGEQRNIKTVEHINEKRIRLVILHKSLLIEAKTKKN